ncbi:MAG: response regulator [Nitrospirae bacterium]|nr:response regulator [Nitrospirota bacterium]
MTNMDKTKRILLMEDDRHLRKVTELMLKKAGYDVATASNGAEAIEIFKIEKDAGRPFDIVILGLIVSDGMGGIETIKAMRAVDPDINAIVSTTHADSPVLSRLCEYGFQAVLRKPYEMNELTETVRQMLTHDTR